LLELSVQIVGQAEHNLDGRATVLAIDRANQIANSQSVAVMAVTQEVAAA